MNDRAINIQCAQIDGWYIQAAVYNIIGPYKPPPNHVNIYGMCYKHSIKWADLQQVANIWVNSLSSSIELQDYLYIIFFK
jgi:hypothetical protein